MKNIVLLLAVLQWTVASTAQKNIPGVKVSVKTFGAVRFSDIAANADEYFKKEQPFVEHNTYNPRKDTAINSIDKINRRIPGYETVTPGVTGIPRRQVLQQELSATGNLQLPMALSGNCISHEGLEDLGTSYPPDVSAGAGFDHNIVALNTGLRIKSKDGSNVSTVTLANFISATGETDVFDPKIFYDHHNNQWIFLCCVARRSAGSGFVVGMSADANPAGSWYFAKVDGDAADKLWYDYPSVGFTYDKIVVTGNMFTNVGDTGYGGRMWVIQKSALASFNTPVVTQFNNILFTTHPAITFGNSGTCYAVAVNDPTVAQLELYSVTGNSATPSMTDNGVVDYGSGNGWAWGLGNVLPQKGTAVKLDAGDTRMLSVISRNGKIWWANNFYWPLASPTYCGVQYGIFNPVTRATIDFAGVWNNTTTQFAYPNIMVNDDEDMGLSFGYFTTTTYASAAYGYVNGGLTLSNLSWNVSHWGDSTYVRGFGSPIRYRWGDYFGIGLDPTDGKSMWITGQYAAARTSGNGTYGTYITKLCATCTASVTTNTPLSNAVKKFEAANSINASNLIIQNSRIKYDAGNVITLSPGFRASAGTDVRIFIEGCGGVN